jgi:hypothetical protein
MIPRIYSVSDGAMLRPRRNCCPVCEQCNRDKYSCRSDRQQVADFREGMVLFDGAEQ